MQIGTDIPVHSIQQNTSATAICTESISCDDTYARIAPGVVAIYCVDPVSKTSGLCTGDLQAHSIAGLAHCVWQARVAQN